VAPLHRPQDRCRGEARCSQNALKHGHRSRATVRDYQRIRRVLRLVARNIAILRAYIRARDQAARPHIKFKRWYTRAGLREAGLSSDLSAEAQRAKAEARPVRRSSKSEGGRAKEELPVAPGRGYRTRMTTDLEIRRKQALFRAQRRGFRELDILFHAFVDKYLHLLDGEQLDRLEALLAVPDWQLYGWIMGKDAVPKPYDNDIFALLCDYRAQGSSRPASL
jgi:antitoxin CptB